MTFKTIFSFITLWLLYYTNSRTVHDCRLNRFVCLLLQIPKLTHFCVWCCFFLDQGFCCFVFCFLFLPPLIRTDSLQERRCKYFCYFRSLIKVVDRASQVKGMRELLNSFLICCHMSGFYCFVFKENLSIFVTCYMIHKIWIGNSWKGRN